MNQQEVWKALADGETILFTDKSYNEQYFVKFINGVLHKRKITDKKYLRMDGWIFDVYNYSIVEKPSLEKRLEQGPVLCWAHLNGQFTTTLTLIKIPDLVGYRDVHNLYWDQAFPAKIEDIERYIWSNDEEI